MLSFGVPWVMGVAVAAALVIAALHLLSVRQPPTLWLPTARFVEAGDARAVARRPRPNDLLLLALRIAALLLAGAALAGARCHAGGPGGVHLVVADSTFRADSAVWWPAIAAGTRNAPGDRSSEVATDDVMQVVWSAGVRTDPGAALVTAQREASRIAASDAAVERIALTVVLPAQVRSTRGWQAWRAAWPGDVRVIPHEHPSARDAALADSSAGRMRFAVAVRSSLEDDPVTAAFADVRTARPVVIERDSLPETMVSQGDTIVVHWPRVGAPRGWHPRTPADSAGGVAAMEVALIAPFVRAYRHEADSTQREHPLVWWTDGEVAAVERTTDGRCTRAVYLPVTAGSDQLQGAAAAGLRTALTAPCGTTLVSTEGLGDSSMARPAAADQFRRAGSVSTRSEPWWLTPLLLVAALSLLVVEQVMRRREVSA
ncbi:hypothetical protein [Gemmatimonas aurantiaca]|nr:hypothetical protein [Gemmatimonas aurantiaca]